MAPRWVSSPALEKSQQTRAGGGGVVAQIWLGQPSKSNEGSTLSFQGELTDLKSDSAAPRLDKHKPCLVGRGSGVQQLD